MPAELEVTTTPRYELEARRTSRDTEFWGIRDHKTGRFAGFGPKGSAETWVKMLNNREAYPHDLYWEKL